MVEDIIGPTFLYDAAPVHDHDLVSHLSNDPQVVGNHDDRRAVLFLKTDHQLKNLSLDRHIQGCGRFVRNKHLRIARQRHRNHGPLAHSAGVLVRVFVHPFLRVGNPHVSKHLYGPFPGLAPGHPLMRADRLHDLVADRENRVEARHRVLKNHGDVIAPDLLHVFLARHKKVSPFEEDLAFRIKAGRGRI